MIPDIQIKITPITDTNMVIFVPLGDITSIMCVIYNNMDPIIPNMMPKTSQVFIIIPYFYLIVSILSSIQCTNTIPLFENHITPNIIYTQITINTMT